MGRGDCAEARRVLRGVFKGECGCAGRLERGGGSVLTIYYRRIEMYV